MAYQFFNASDFEAAIQSKLFTANSQGDPNAIMEPIEKKKIAFITSKLSSRYNMTAVFAEVDDDRNQIILEILLNLCMYSFLRRNAARKVSTDVKDDYNWAIKELEKLQSGHAYAGLPPALDEVGAVENKPIHANTTNPNNYI